MDLAEDREKEKNNRWKSIFKDMEPKNTKLTGRVVSINSYITSHIHFFVSIHGAPTLGWVPLWVVNNKIYLIGLKQLALQAGSWAFLNDFSTVY